jgi:uncharacterized membrane protein
MEYVKSVLIVHVIAGALSLLTGLLVYLLKKGTSLHIRIGKIYYLAMSVVFITSIYVSLMKNNAFLFLIGIFSYYLVYTGILYNRNRSVGKTGPMDFIRILFFAIIFVSMILFGLYCLISGASGLGIILLVFGGIGGMLAKTDIYVYLLKKEVDKPNFWIRSHLGRMTGSYIAAVTAFAVNNIHFLPPIVIWLLPTAIGFFLIYFYDRKYSG